MVQSLADRLGNSMGGGRTYQVTAVGLDHGVEDGDGEPPPPPGGRGRGRGRGRRGAPGDELGLLLLVVSGGPPPPGGRGRALPDGRDVRDRGEGGGERKEGRGEGGGGGGGEGELTLDVLVAADWRWCGAGERGDLGVRGSEEREARGGEAGARSNGAPG